jgi:hypothetical protein
MRKYDWRATTAKDTRETVERLGAEFLAQASDEGLTGLKLDVHPDARADGWRYHLDGDLVHFAPAHFYPTGVRRIVALAGSTIGGREGWTPDDTFSTFREACDAIAEKVVERLNDTLDTAKRILRTTCGREMP